MIASQRWHQHPHVRSGAQLSFGERAADKVRNGMGSWRFIWVQTAVVISWVALNVWFLSHSFDPYPFILLNLAFSTQAAYAAPMILLSQVRSDQQSSELALSTHANGETLLDLNQQQLRILQQLETLRIDVDKISG